MSTYTVSQIVVPFQEDGTCMWHAMWSFLAFSMVDFRTQLEKKIEEKVHSYLNICIPRFEHTFMEDTCYFNLPYYYPLNNKCIPDRLPPYRAIDLEKRTVIFDEPGKVESTLQPYLISYHNGSEEHMVCIAFDHVRKVIYFTDSINLAMSMRLTVLLELYFKINIQRPQTKRITNLEPELDEIAKKTLYKCTPYIYEDELRTLLSTENGYNSISENKS